MINQIDHIVEHLFPKKKLEEVSVYELERFVATYPYFATGHFLLAKKAQANHQERTEEKVATTALYYNNSLWLQWLLDLDLYADPKTREPKDPVALHHAEKNIGADKNKQEQVDREAREMIELAIGTNNTNGETDTTLLHAERDTPVDTENEYPAGNGNETFPPAQEVETVVPNQPDVKQENSTDHIIESPVQTESETGIGSYIETEDETESITENEILDEPAHTGYETASSNNPAENVEVLSTYHGLTEEEENTEDQSPGQNETSSSDNEEEESRASAASIEKTLTSAALIPTKGEVEKNEIAFEPYHTIDYFASQGIKLQQSDLSKDKFGKQLKSFTEWLRSMKRLPQVSLEATLDEATQQSIQNIAEHSFEEKEIVTETMAEVWIKQGNKEKAIDTLLKLSLLNPSKSHYFAAKIEQLKAS